MLGFIIRRLLFLPFLWLAITFLTFLFLEPLGPYQRVALFMNIDPERAAGGKLTKEQLERLIDKYGLRDPAPVQYVRWLKQILFEKNFGWSKVAQKPVFDAIFERLPATFELGLYAILPVIAIAIWLGVLSAVHHNKPLDHTMRFFSITGYSLPTFVFGIFVLMFFYGILGWFPPGRLSFWAERIVYDASQFTRYTGLNTIDAIFNNRWDIFEDALRHLILPVLTLSYLSWAGLQRVTRSSMLETLRQDYITTARAKGLIERVVILKHGLRNALIPVTTIAVPTVIGLMLSGVVITETVFNYKGLGLLSVDATLQFDVPTVLGFLLIGTALIVLTNLLVDILYVFIDPRVRYD
jgi:peptide/nickel transport system permease protein